GLTYGIGSGFSYSKDLASFGISSATRNEAVGKLVRESVRVLRELKSGPIPEEEVATAKEYLVGGFPLSTATLSAVAARWLGGTIFGLGPEYLNEFIPRVGAVKASDVSAAVAKDFDLSQLVIVIAGDAKEIRKGLAGYPSREVIRLGVKDLL
ncbi:MAG: insulinase family protein, partial [Oligoflexia bacterium]|nr:insulinase family protein [Oligoflexia bacterium]